MAGRFATLALSALLALAAPLAAAKPKRKKNAVNSTHYQMRKGHCTVGPDWTPPDQAADWYRPPVRPHATKSAGLPPFYLYSGRDGPDFSLGRMEDVKTQKISAAYETHLGQAARRNNSEMWQKYVARAGSTIQHRGALLFLEALIDHPQRVQNATDADLLVVPMVDWRDWDLLAHRGSSRLGRLTRSRATLQALAASDLFKARGADHVVLHGGWCGWGLCRGAELPGLAALYAAGATVGTLDRTYFGTRQVGLAAWRARAPGASEQEVGELYAASTVLVPYVAAPEYSAATPGDRTSFLFEGQHGQKAFPEEGEARLRRLAKKLPGARACFAPRPAHGRGDVDHSPAKVAASAAVLRGADACLVMAAEFSTSARLYDVLAAGCAPVVLADDAARDVLPFSASIDWGSIAHVAASPKDDAALNALARGLAATGPEEWADRRAKAAEAFSTHLDYVGNARGVADAFLRQVAASRRARDALLRRVARPSWRRPAGGLAGFGTSEAGGACPKVAFLVGHARSGTTRLGELVFRRDGVHYVDEPMATFQDLGVHFPESLEVHRLFRRPSMLKAYDATSKLLACEEPAMLEFIRDATTRSRQLRHAVDAAALGPAAAKVQACAGHTGRPRFACFRKEAPAIADAWAKGCKAAPLRAAKEIRLNGAVGVQLLTEGDLLASLATKFGCAPRVFVLHLVRHPVDVLVSNRATPGLNGIGGRGDEVATSTLVMAGPDDLDERTLLRAEAEAMCHQTLLDLAAGSILDEAPSVRTKTGEASARAARKIVRYQDLVREPEQVGRDVAAWLGLPVAPAGAPAWPGPAALPAFSTDRRREDFVFGAACDDVAPSVVAVVAMPSCARLVETLQLERACSNSSKATPPRAGV